MQAVPKSADQPAFTLQEIFAIYEEFGVFQAQLVQWAIPENEILALIEKVRERCPRKLLDAGMFAGATSVFLALEVADGAQIHSLQPKLDVDPASPFPTQDIAQKVAEQLGVAQKIVWHAGGFTSNQICAASDGTLIDNLPVIGKQICDKHGPFDFIVLSGFRDAEIVSSDLELAAASLSPGGIIALDGTLDLNWGSHIRRAIFSFMKDRSDYVFFQKRDWGPVMDIGFLEHFPPGNKSYQLDVEYDQDFYDRSLEMHQQVVPHLARRIQEIHQPRSVIDLGCGAGIWLKAFQALGVSDLCGVDGSREAIEERNRDLASVVSVFDLREVFTPAKRYDLCLCLDVIEHIEPQFEDNFIQSIVNSSDTIIFSSPPPGQGGDSHVNERPIAHWVEKFWEHGYLLLDNLRPHFEGVTHIPLMTYQLNFYTAKKLFDRKTSTLTPAQALTYLSEKEARIEELFLQTFFQRREIDFLRSGMTIAAAPPPPPPQLIDPQEIQREQAIEIMAGVPLVDFQLPVDQVFAEEGHCYVYRFRTFAAQIFARIMKHCEFMLFEDGKALPLGHQFHSDIRELGEGRHSIWNAQLYFSTSDNSDPRTNNRVYSISLPAFADFVERMPSGGIQKFRL